MLGNVKSSLEIHPLFHCSHSLLSNFLIFDFGNVNLSSRDKIFQKRARDDDKEKTPRCDDLGKADLSRAAGCIWSRDPIRPATLHEHVLSLPQRRLDNYKCLQKIPQKPNAVFVESKQPQLDCWSNEIFRVGEMGV
jgi:hypothetical protein